MSVLTPGLPGPRGASSQHLFDVLRRDARDVDTNELDELVAAASAPAPAIVDDEDRLIMLWVLQELGYHGFQDVDDRWEVDHRAVWLRVTLEDALESALRPIIDPVVERTLTEARTDLAETLFSLPEREFADTPSLAAYARRKMSIEQWCEMLVLKSAYQLKEGDPHTFAVPRLSAEAKLAMVEIQFDEYGSGRLADLHSELFARAMVTVGLRDDFGAYADCWPAPVLAANVALNWWSSRREWAGAVAGHLAMIETTSSLPCRKYVAGAQRLGLPEDGWRYFDEHVEADAAHEQIAIRQMCPAAAEADGPGKVIFGFVAGLYLDGRIAEYALQRWESGESALRHPLSESADDPTGDPELEPAYR